MRKLLIFAMVLAMGLVTIGCSETPKKIQQENRKNMNSQDIKQAAYEGAIKGESIANSLVMEKGIVDASAVVLDNRAIVAVVLLEGETLTKQRLDKIKEIVKSSDKKINKLSITQDNDLFFKIDNIAQTMMKEENSESIKKDFENIMNTIGIENI